jgi:hypothetical protein
MQMTFLHGYPDYIGKRFAWAGYGTGPVSYVGGATGGDPLIFPRFDNYIDTVESTGMLSTDGTYIAFAQSTGVGARQTWNLRYFAFTTAGVGAEAVNGTNLSTKNFQLSGLGGVY